MKHLLLTTAALVMSASFANAADLPRRPPPPVKAVPYVAPVYNWTGAYVGLNGGYGWGNSDVNGPFSSSHNMSGGLIGGTLGYNIQAGSIVYGLETDLDWSNIRGSGACGATTCETRNTWLGTTRGRLGIAMDRFMPYVTGGMAYGGIENNIAGVGTARSTKLGWTLGAGVEAAIAPQWTAKFEYLYVDLGHTAAVAGSEADMRSNILRAGLNYRF